MFPIDKTAIKCHNYIIIGISETRSIIRRIKMGRETVNLQFEDGVRTLSFTDVTLPKDEWKELREGASSEQLFFLGLGTKIRLRTVRKQAYILTLLLALVIGAAILIAIFANTFAGIAIGVIGYLIFGLLLCGYIKQ